MKNDPGLSSHTTWMHAAGALILDQPRIFGIVNVTPDSFSDGGQLGSVDDARRLIDRLVRDGADVIDVGGESTRPGAAPVDSGEEIRRVVPVIAAAVRDHPGVPISIDTVKARVAAEALGAGASIVNDVSALRLDPGMAAVCREAGAGVVLMHSRGDVADMASFAHAEYGDDVVGEIATELLASAAAAIAAGIDHARIVLDPGIGFSKRAAHSLRVLACLPRLASLGFPVLVGASRKRFIGEIIDTAGHGARTAPVGPARDAGSIGAHVAALNGGARLFRVHEVRAHRDALDVAWAIRRSAP